MKTNVLGYPRIGANRELKKASEKYWKNEISEQELIEVSQKIKAHNWSLQKGQGIDLIPSNDFSFYDQVLDTSFMLGAIPKRFTELQLKVSPLEVYFAVARGYQKNGFDLTASEMTKWFDTNYHYLVPEFYKNQSFHFSNPKVVNEYLEAKALGIETKPVLLAPVSYLLLGKEKEAGFDKISLLDKLLPVYKQIVQKLIDAGANYIQFDEPILSLDISSEAITAIQKTYHFLAAEFPQTKFILTSYFECYGQHLEAVLDLPVHAIHLDLVRCSNQLDDILELSNSKKTKAILSLGVIDGRNIWKNNFEKSLSTIAKAQTVFADDQLWLATSCSLLHTPCDLDLELELSSEIKDWLSYAKQKIDELALLKKASTGDTSTDIKTVLEANKASHTRRLNSNLIHNQATKQRVEEIKPAHSSRKSVFEARQKAQKLELKLPLFPTTTIGSFPQTAEVRNMRSQWKKKSIDNETYNKFLANEIEESIRFQEKIDIDVLVHGEFERNDMVEYFGEQLKGFTFSKNGWVQSYGSRCVKPPIIYGDVYRPSPMTVEWTAYAQTLTTKPVKGMLTGPVTILQWSFVRDDQDRSTTCKQIALAIRDEVVDLEKAGIQIIQIDEPAIREGLPLRKENWASYLSWSIEAFRISVCGVEDTTQIHTHMCYSEFNDIIKNIAEMDADVITIETSRSEMELLNAFVDFKYPNEIGPGVYDIHSPRIPNVEEIQHLLQIASKCLPIENIWVNPDCGLKTRDWPETKVALENMVNAAKKIREEVQIQA